MIRHPAAPPPGDDPEADYEDFERRYAALNLAQLAAMVGAADGDAKDKFDDALSRALPNFHLFMRDTAAPTRREMRAKYTAIESRASALLAALETLHYQIWMEMQDSYEQRMTDDFDEDRWAEEGLWFADVEWDVVVGSVARLRDVVTETRVTLPSARKGRRTEFGIWSRPWRVFIRRTAVNRHTPNFRMIRSGVKHRARSCSLSRPCSRASRPNTKNRTMPSPKRSAEWLGIVCAVMVKRDKF